MFILNLHKTSRTRRAFDNWLFVYQECCDGLFCKLQTVNMSWPSVIGSIFYYVILILGTVFYFIWSSLNAILAFLLVIIAPVTHLATYIAHGFLVPIYFLSKFEVCSSTQISSHVSIFSAILWSSILPQDEQCPEQSHSFSVRMLNYMTLLISHRHCIYT